MDLFTFIAQIANFLILVAFLTAILYRPVLKAIDEREKRITAAEAALLEARSRAETEIARHHALATELQEKRETLLSQIRLEAEQERSRLQKEIQLQTEELRQKWVSSAERDLDRLAEGLSRSILEKAYLIAQQTIKELADQNIETAIVERFCRELKAIPHERAKTLAAALHPKEPLIIRSAFPLDEESRERLEHAIRSAVPSDAPLKFEESPEEIGGIEVMGGGHRIVWSIRRYTADLARSLRAFVRESTREAQLAAGTRTARS